MAIPKIIHYCWFGQKPIPKILKYCLDTWKQVLVDYEFMLWNESNSELDCEFIKKVYAEKKWAFVSDYIRLKVIYEYGGVYLDTDMLLLKKIDFFLKNECFFVAEHEKSIGVCVFGAIKEHNFIKLCLNTYQKKDAEVIPMPKIISDIFIEKYYLERNFQKNISLKDIVIYEPNYFYSLPYTKLFDIHHYRKYLTNNSYGVHLWYGSWHNYNELILLRRKEYFKAIKAVYNSVFKEGKFNYRYVKKVMIAFKDSIKTRNAFK